MHLLPKPGRDKGGNGGRKNLSRRGNPGNKGGGRKPEAFTALAKRLVREYALLDRVAKMAKGEPILQHDGYEKDGTPVVVMYPASAGEQIKAAALVIAYAHGQPTEKVVHEGDGQSFVMVSPKMPSTIDEWRRMFLPSKS